MFELILAYIIGAVLVMNALTALSIFTDLFIDVDEMVFLSAVWPATLVSLGGRLVGEEVCPWIQRASFAAYAWAVGTYWTLRAKLPF